MNTGTPRYTVKAGDTLSHIALRFYGDAGFYPQIAEANGIADPDHIEVGQVLALPEFIVRSGDHTHMEIRPDVAS